MKMSKFVTIVAAVMVGCFIIAGILLWQEGGIHLGDGLNGNLVLGDPVSVDQEKTASVDGVREIKVRTTSEDITIIPTDSHEIKAHLSGQYASSNKDYRPELTVTPSGSSLEIKVEHLPKNTIHFSYSGNLKLDVYLPKAYAEALDVDATSANVSADELNIGKLTVNTTSGDIKVLQATAKDISLETTSGNGQVNGTFDSFQFKATSGDFTSENLVSQKTSFGTSSGNVRIKGSVGDMEFHSSSGDLVSDAITATSARVESSSGKAVLKGNPGNVVSRHTSGDLTLEYSEFAADIRAESSSGNVTIKLPANAEFAVRYDASSGRPTIDFPVTIQGTQGDHKLEGVVVSDKHKINVSASSGDLKIIK